MNNSYLIKSIFIAVLALAVGAGIGYGTKDASLKMKETDSMNGKEISFAHQMRDLWAQHVIWTREYVVAFAADLPGTDDVTSRLLKNQEDIGNSIKPYYGEEAGNRLTGLLKEHITIAVGLLEAVKAEDEEMTNDANMRWKENARKISSFFKELNSDWDENSINNMLDEHLNLTSQSAVAQLNGNWKESISKFDQIFDQAMAMSDMLSHGIIKQFPDKF